MRHGLLRPWLAVFVFCLAACTADEPTPLNSERIEQTFGSYGIDVLASDESLRLSNLYSIHEDRNVTRTFAIVGYPERVDTAFAAAHAEILAGGSIGAVFTANGWDVVKHHRMFGELEAPPALVQLMTLEGRPELAFHIYDLEVVRQDERFDYARIVEVHHPDYLRLDDLETIYGPPRPAGAFTQDAERRLLTRGLDALAALLSLEQAARVGR